MKQSSIIFILIYWVIECEDWDSLYIKEDDYDGEEINDNKSPIKNSSNESNPFGNPQKEVKMKVYNSLQDFLNNKPSNNFQSLKVQKTFKTINSHY